MKQIILLLTAVLLVSGCVLSQDEIAQAQQYMKDISGQLHDADTAMQAHQWDKGKASFSGAESTLSKLDVLAKAAEERGLEAEKVNRIKAGSEFMHKQFDFVSGLTTYYIQSEDMKSKLDKIDWQSADIAAIKAEINALISKADEIKFSSNSFLSSADQYKKDFPEDAGKIHVDETTTNVYKSIAAVNEIKTNFQSVLDRLPS